MQDGYGQQPPLSRAYRWTLVAVVVFGFVVLIYGFQRIGYSIRSPFVTDTNTKIATSTVLTPDKLDTDKDGLSDQEESDFYGTSAFLPDSDGDGITDYQEIQAGTDPLCAEGKDCSVVASNANTLSINTSNTNSTGVITTTNINTKQASNVSVGAGDTPDEIRETLRALGIAESLLANVPDSQLSEIYASALQSYQDSGAADLLNTSTDTTPTNASLSTLTPTQVDQLSDTQLRTILIDAGFTESLLQSMSADDLRATVKGALSQ